MNRVFQVDYHFIWKSKEIFYPQCELKVLFRILVDMIYHDKYDLEPQNGWETRIVDDDWPYETLEENSLFVLARLGKGAFQIRINTNLTNGYVKGCDVLASEDLYAIAQNLKEQMEAILYAECGTRRDIAIYEIPQEYWEFINFENRSEYLGFLARESVRIKKKIVRSPKFD